MKYPYAVKYSGQYYAAGEEVPDNGTSFSNTVDIPAQAGNDTTVDEDNSAEPKRRGRKPKTEE